MFCIDNNYDNFGNMLKWLGFSSREMQINSNINVAGYAYNENKKIVQYQSEGPVLDVSQKGINYYSSTKGGQSGGPVFESDFIACGIHHGGSELGKYNNGSRINTCLFSILQKHKLTGKETYGYE